MDSSDGESSGKQLAGGSPDSGANECKPASSCPVGETATNDVMEYSMLGVL